MPNWELIRKEWETTKITFKALAEKHDVKEGTLKSRRSREKWEKDATKKKKKDASIKKVATAKEPIILDDSLNDMQQLFCIYYIKSFNQTMAAIKAGYAKNRAHITGSELVRNSKVAEEIRRLKGEMQQGIFIDAMDVLNKYVQIAFADITDFVDFGSVERSERNPDTGEVLLDDNFNPITYKQGFVDFKESDVVDGTIITEVKLGRDGVSVKLADKMKALEMLSKYTDLLSNDDRKRLQEEKLIADIAKTNADIDKNNEVDKPIEIMIRRKEKGDV